jgi:hypothetical protein
MDQAKKPRSPLNKGLSGPVSWRWSAWIVIFGFENTLRAYLRKEIKSQIKRDGYFRQSERI